jgi:hypothetical protein
LSFVDVLRRNPAFARMWVAEAISLAGDWFSLVAICALAVQSDAGSGALAVALTLVAHELPMALMRPIAGVLADRFDRRNLLLLIHVGQAVLTAWMVERALAADLVGLQALVFVRSTMGGLDWPARSGAIRRLVAPDDVMVAYALGGATWSAMYAVGMSLGGLVASQGIPLALAVDAGSFLVAAALLLTLPPIPTRGTDGVGLRRSVGVAWTDLMEAVRLARADGALLRAVTSKTPLGVAGGAGLVVLNLVAADSTLTSSGAASLGVLQAVRGMGTGLGPMVGERLVRAGWARLTVWRLAAWTAFAGIAAFALPLGSAAAVAAVAVWGCGTGANWMLSGAEIQRLADDHTIGRLSGLDFLCVELAMVVSALGAGLLIEATGAVSTGITIGVAAGVGCWVAIQVAATR